MLLTIAAIAIIIAGLKAAGGILMPLAVASFVAIICLPGVLFLQHVHLSAAGLDLLRKMKLREPWVRGVERWRIGTPLAVLIVVLGLLGSCVGVGILVGTSIGDFQQTIDDYRSERKELSEGAKDLQGLLSRIPDLMQGSVGFAEAGLVDAESVGRETMQQDAPPEEEAGQDEAGGDEAGRDEAARNDVAEDGEISGGDPEGEAAEGETARDAVEVGGESSGPPVRGESRSLLGPSLLLNLTMTVVAGAGTLLSSSFLVLMIAALLLLEAAGLPAKLRTAMGDPTHDLRDFSGIVIKIQRYLWIKTVVSLATGLVLGLWCWLWGVDFPVLWGVLAFVLNFVPNIGSILAMIPPVILAFAQIGTGTAGMVLAGYLMANAVIGNVLEPQLMGKQLGLSPLVVFLSMVFWGWTWGPAGMFLSVPLTMSVKIFLENTRDLRWMAVLMGGAPDLAAEDPSEQPSASGATPRPRSTAGAEGVKGGVPARRRLRRRAERSGE